ncbi:hypothetical protein [Paenibacillus sp. DCT19]|uniref:hypothetical protein n=1 Tax=Paenibacillus sp. DCT19 TaxID=2211212 RepID=UPI000FE1C369|nr:hypothetical protein [Paenibacillus sp. DCT19]
MKKILISVLTASTLLTSSVYATPSEVVNIKASSIASSFTKESNRIKYSIYNLSDQQIKNAIAIGKKGYDSLQALIEKNTLPISVDKLKVLQPEVSVSTPYIDIAYLSYFAAEKYDTYTFKEAKSYADLYRKHNALTFKLNVYGNSSTFTNGLNVVLKQGNKILQPIEIYGQDSVDVTRNWPNSPAYRATLFADFDLSKVDFSKKAELVYLYGSKKNSVSYKVDFSKLK